MRLKIALISLYVFENNGVRLLAACLRRAGFEVHEIYFKDYLHHHYVGPTEVEVERMLGVLREQGIGFVGISVRAGAYLKVGIQFSNLIRERLGLPVAFGGAHISFDREVGIHHCDYLAVGEAEDSIVELATAIETGGDTTAIPGIWANAGGVIHRNEVRDLAQDLDRLPFRDYHSHDFKWVIDGDRFDRGDPVIGERIYLMLSSRGCAFSCKFCDVNILRKIYKGKGMYFRVRSPQNVIEELRYARECFKGLTRIRFDDELFPFDREWTREFARLYKAEFDWPFEILTDPRVVVDENIAELKRAGLDHVLMGVQASEDVNRRLFGRHHSDERVIEVSRILRRHRVKASYQIILDIPTTTTKDREATLDLLLRMARPFDLYSFSLSLWPGTDLTESLLEQNIVSPSEVAGVCDKVLTQFRADDTMARPAEERLFMALYHLTSKSFVPRALIAWMGRSPALRRNPGVVMWLSGFTNFVKLGLTALEMLWRRELTWNMVRRFFNLRAPVSI